MSKSYILATTESVVRWYAFNTSNPTTYSIIEKLDLSKVPAAENKETAKHWANLMGLKSWRYVSL